MSSTLKLTGFTELISELDGMAKRLSDKAAAERILTEAAQPVYAAAQRFAPKGRTGTLEGALKIGKVKKTRRGGYTIKIGTQTSDKDAFYAGFVEFGHGGPRGPAAEHPFMRPAYDTTKETAYAIIRDRLANELKNGG